MAKLEALVQDFLAQKQIAVVGVSDKRDTVCNAGYRKFKEAGYIVRAVNPRLTTFDGDPCYPDLKSIPLRPYTEMNTGPFDRGRQFRQSLRTEGQRPREPHRIQSLVRRDERQ